ncbi:MAG TPA: phosphopantetheine-protein transferase [Ktedonobacter sp.]|nr:phosphopantetheine-protein transferase [Ktedonobacter sp.]
MQTSRNWQTPTSQSNLTLPDNDVHVWRANLNIPLPDVQSLQHTLSPDERARAYRFRFERHRNHFIVARGTLRTLLALYLNISPTQLHFRYNAYGKPSLESPHTPLHFNISHSHELALLAFSQHRELGVDVEYMDRNIDYNELAQHTFSPYEAAIVTALSDDAKRQAFFNCWTRKEAYIKARGMGVSLDLTSFDVSLKPGDAATLLHNREDAMEVTRWQFEALHVGDGYAGAIAVEGHNWQLCTWQW